MKPLITVDVPDSVGVVSVCELLDVIATEGPLTMCNSLLVVSETVVKLRVTLAVTL